MKKYWSIIKNEVQRQFTYRVAIFTYAFGNIAELVALTVVWSVVYKNIDIIRGYSMQEMISYVVFAWFFSFLTTTYAFESNVARDIQYGTLSNLLLKPMSYLRYAVAVATGRVFIAFLVVIIQGIIIFSFFKDRLIFPSDRRIFILLAIMLAAAYVMNLFISIIVGFIAFWATEISGIYHALKIIKNFLSGYYFPIILFPAALMKVSLFSPFAYIAYIPVQLFIGKISYEEGLRGLSIEILWLVALYIVIKIVWRFGLRRYESVGI